jgi:hypothetical protein
LYRAIVRARVRRLRERINRGDAEAAVKMAAPGLRFRSWRQTRLWMRTSPVPRHSARGLLASSTCFRGITFEVREILVAGWPWNTRLTVRLGVGTACRRDRVRERRRTIDSAALGKEGRGYGPGGPVSTHCGGRTPGSSRRFDNIEGQVPASSSAGVALRPVTSVFVFGRRPRTCKDLRGRSGSKTCPAAWEDLSGITSSISALPARGRDTRRGKPDPSPISGTSPRLDGIEWGCCPR